MGASLIVHELNENTYSSLMFCSGRAKAFRIVILRFLGLFDEDSAKKLSISYLLSRAVHLLKALQAQPVTVSLDAASWANLRKCDMKRKEHVCRTIFKKISRNLVAHLRPAAYVLVLVGWAALDFVCFSNTRRTSTLFVPDLQNFGQFWNPRTLGGAFLGGLVHHVQHQHRILPTLNWGGIYMHSPIVS